MNKQMIYMGIALLSISISCKNPSEKEKQAKADTETHHSSASGVMLDNGKKWIANPETTTGIETMSHLVQDYKKEDDVAKLKENLESEFQMIFEKCTMTGMAHDQLHNFLHPLKDKLDGLSNSESSVQIKEIDAYLADYPNYFK